jgi:mono/diheme cytochrome c family protein
MADFPARDRRHDPTRNAIIVAAVVVQLGAVFVAWAIHRANLELPRPTQLMAEVLSPEDMVYADSDVPAQRGTTLPPVDLAVALLPTAARIEEGRQLYGEHCASCHGDGGAGDGPAGTLLEPKPRNLQTVAGWTAGTRLSELFTTVTVGLEGTAMPGFDYLPVDERFSIAHYVITLAAGHQQDTASSIQALDERFSLSKGASEPNVIPVGMAIERLAAEAPQVPAIDETRLAELRRIEPLGAELYDRAVNPDRAEVASWWLTADRSWIGDPARLRLMVTRGMPANGFLPRASLMTAAEWKSLERYLWLKYQQGAVIAARE